MQRPDEITPSVLQECVVTFGRPLELLFSKSREEGPVTKEWKCVKIMPVFKTGYWENALNYKPLSECGL